MKHEERPLRRAVGKPWRPAVGLLAMTLLVACGPLPKQSAEALHLSYVEALARTAPPVAVRLGPDGRAEEEVLERLESYFAAMTEQRVRAMTAEVYAPDAYLNDNLAVIEGLSDIEAYFLAAASQLDLLEVRFEDVARSDVDYYVRWTMTLRGPGLSGGEPVSSSGVSHFRFDMEGRVLLHRDFWDAGTGLYEHLRGIGSVVRRVRGAMHPQ